MKIVAHTLYKENCINISEDINNINHLEPETSGINKVSLVESLDQPEPDNTGNLKLKVPCGASKDVLVSLAQYVIEVDDTSDETVHTQNM